MLDDLPDDMLRCIVQKISSPRVLMCLAATNRRLYRLVREDTHELPVVTFTCVQRGMLRWLLSAWVCERLTSLVIRRCMYGPGTWLSRLQSLRSLTLAFCRVRPQLLDALPCTLEHLDVHQLLPTPGWAHCRLRVWRLRNLRRLRVVFATGLWDAAFVSRLPPRLRQVHLRGSRVLVVESHMPRGLRDVALHAAHIMLLSNRLPNTVRRVCLSCDHGYMWLRDTLPLNPRRLQCLSIKSPGCVMLAGIDRMRRLRHLSVKCTVLLVDWTLLARLPLLCHLDLHVRDWLACSSVRWPASKPLPRHARLTVHDVAVDLPSLLFKSMTPLLLPYIFPVPVPPGPAAALTP